jgi:hypothetical protein
VALVQSAYGSRFERLFDRWLSEGLLVDVPRRSSYALSADGSWFVGNMIQEARSMAEAVRWPLALMETAG